MIALQKEVAQAPGFSGLSRNPAPDGFSSVFPQMRSNSNKLQFTAFFKKIIQTEIDMSGAIFLVYCTCTKIIKNQINILRSNNLPLPTLPGIVDSKRFHVDPASELNS